VGFFLAGEDPKQTWQNFYDTKSNPRQNSWIVCNRHASEYPEKGCHRCTNQGCAYADFIRLYLKYPISD
jgi:hypothetical protein